MRGLLWSIREDEGLLISAFVLLRGTAEELSRPSYWSDSTSPLKPDWQSDCINRCFQREAVDHSHWDQIEVCMFSVSRCVFLWCSLYVFGLKRLLGKVISFSPPTFPSVGGVISPLLAPHLSQVYSLLTTICGISSPLRSLNHYSSSLSHASRLASPGAPVWDFLTFNTSVCLCSSGTPHRKFIN